MKILVTGGAGFIGSHVTKLLLDQGHKVTVVDNLSSARKEAVDTRAKLEKISLDSPDQLKEVLPGQDLVVHAAAFIEVAESVEDPYSFVQNNIANSVNLLEAMRKTGVNKIIFSSSACVYGVPTRLPLTEDSPIGKQSNPYGITKLTMEQFCTLYHDLHGFDVTILRYFNPYGPRELHEPETHAIPNFITAALDRRPIPLYWKGEQVRDFIYIDDLARAHTAVINLTGFNIFNIGTETGVQVRDVLEKIFGLIGYEVPIKNLGERTGDVPALYASAQKIKQEIGWEAQVSLEDGLSKTIEFFKNRRK